MLTGGGGRALVTGYLNAVAQSISRSIELTPKPERVCNGKRCLGLRGECLTPIKRDLL